MKQEKSSFAALVSAILVACLFAPAAFCEPSTNAAQSKPRLLVVTVTKGYRHASIPTGERIVQELANKSGAFTVDYARTEDDLKSKMSLAALTNYAGVFFLNTTGVLPLPDKAVFLNYIHSGKGFIGTHSATDTFHSTDGVDPYIEMIGGEFVEHTVTQVVCHNEDPMHPGTRHFGRAWSVFDEIYVVKNFSRNQSHVLLSLNRSPSSAERGDFPISWTRDYGAGRVFYTALGHEDAVWENNDFQLHLLGGIKWALRIEAVGQK